MKIKCLEKDGLKHMSSDSVLPFCNLVYFKKIFQLQIPLQTEAVFGHKKIKRDQKVQKSTCQPVTQHQ